MVQGSRRFSMKSIYCTLILLLVIPAVSAAQTPSADSKPATAPAPRKLDKAAAYYHYTLAHMYEEQVAVYGRSELANKAIEEYRLAIDADPTSEYLTSALAELYAKTGRIRDAVLEAQDILKRDPNNLEAHKLLGRIYLRSLGDVQAGQGSQNVLKLAIEQYEQIIKIEPDNVDDHLLLGRLYRLNNDLQKAEDEFKTRGQAGARFGRSRHHAGLPLQRRRRHGPGRRSPEFDPGRGALRQALFGAGLHLRTAEAVQELDHCLPESDRARPRQSRRDSRPGPEPDERRPDRCRARAVQDHRGRESRRCADLPAHGGDLPQERQVRPGAGELEEGRVHGAGLDRSALQHGRRVPGAGPLRRSHPGAAGSAQEDREGGQQLHPGREE